jgi:WD40 repeat protein
MKQIAIGGMDDDIGLIQVYDDNFSLIKKFQAHENWISHILQIPNGLGLVATVSYDKTAKIWNSSNDWSLISNFTGHTNFVNGLDYLNEDSMITGSLDSTIKFWSITTSDTVRTIQTNSGVWSLKVLHGGVHLACGLSSGSINIYNIENGALSQTLQGHVSWVMDLVLIGDDLLASSGYDPDSTVRIWNLTNFEEKYVLRGHANNVFGLKLLENDILASASEDYKIKLWNITNGSLIRTLSNHTAVIYWSLDFFDEESKLLMSGSKDRSIKFWNFTTGHTKDVNFQIRSLAVIIYYGNT